MLKSKIATAAYNAGHKVTLAPLLCPYCAKEVRAADAELHDNGDFRIVCGHCHVDLLSVEQR